MRKILLFIGLLFSTASFGQVYYSLTDTTYVSYGLNTDTKPTPSANFCYFVEVNTNKTFVSNAGVWTLVGIGVDSIATRLAFVTDSLATALAASIAATYATITTVNGKQPLATNLTSIGGLANGNGFLKNNGSGTFSYETPAGSGDLLAANNLSDLANSATARTNIGLSTTANLTNSTNKNFVTDAQTTVIGNTSGTNTGDDATNTQYSGLAASKQDALISGTNIKTINGTTILGAGNVTITSTAGVGTSPTASSTVTITHNLGRVPTIIRIYGYGTFTANAAATATTSSMGVFNSSGNFCVYQRYGAAITTTQAGLTSNTFCILLATGGGSFISGVIQNVTSTQFDISWTETGTATAQPYLWESQ